MHILAVDAPNWTTVFASGSAALLVAVANIAYQAISHKGRVRYETRFQTMHEKQSEAIQTLYRKLFHACRAVGEYTELEGKPQNGVSILEERSQQAIDDTTAYFEQHQLLFPEFTARRIHEFLEIIYEAHFSFRKCIAEATPIEEAKHHLEVARTNMSKDVSPRLVSLRETFRTMMSVEHDEF